MTLAAARSEQAWLQHVRLLVAQGHWNVAERDVAMALAEWPGSLDLMRAAAGIAQHAGRVAEAEVLMHDVLTLAPQDGATAFALARLLQAQGRTAALAAVITRSFTATPGLMDPDLAITAIELLDDCDRKQDAAHLAEAAVHAHPADARLHAYTGMLAVQVGEFERAREHYLYALEHDPRAWEWHVPIGLSSAQRYQDREHPDRARFEDGLRRPGLSDMARAELHFCLGKLHDDLAGHAEAARNYRAGNAIRHRLSPWSRKAWRRAIEARLAAKPWTASAKPTAGFTPVFIVGMPRSGTTLLARLLSRQSGVCNRGELPWLARLALQPELGGTPSPAELQKAAADYARHSRQDDAADMRWFLDKQPLNFRYLDLALGLFPDARIVHCRRNPRDTALSLWMQCFLEDVQGYSYDFEDIRTVIGDEQRLMSHWHQRYPDAIRTIDYEDLVADPEAAIAALAAWIGLPATPSPAATQAGAGDRVISTASLWQARQPVHARSVERWRAYAESVPELLRIPLAR